MELSDKSEHIIFNLNRLPFRDFNAAAGMRDLLQKESGNQYRIEQYRDNDGEGVDMTGFVVIRSNQNVEKLHNDKTSQHTNDVYSESGQHDELTSENITEQSTQIYHPALRTYVLYLPILFTGIVLLFFPYETWSLILSALEINGLPNWIDIALLIKITKGLGAILFFYHGISVLYSYFAISLIVDNQGVILKRGIIAQDIINIRFSEIKTIGLKRGILARLINIGTLEFASSGSDGVDIRFINLASPAKVKQDIENRIDEVIRASKAK